jgi:hypothetical protein
MEGKGYIQSFKEHQENLNISDVRSSDYEKFYKWIVDNDVYCARVVGKTANYYKNGELYASYQQFILRDTDTQITEREFNKMIGI